MYNLKKDYDLSDFSELGDNFPVEDLVEYKVLYFFEQTQGQLLEESEYMQRLVSATMDSEDACADMQSTIANTNMGVGVTAALVMTSTVALVMNKELMQLGTETCKWGVGSAMLTLPYPSLRLCSPQTTVSVVGSALRTCRTSSSSVRLVVIRGVN